MSYKVLLIEDNEGDILLTKETFEIRNVVSEVLVARDGEEAITLLENLMRTQPANLPDLVLLDINLPRRNGHEVLQFVKNSIQLRHIPVIILTTSNSDRDVNMAYRNFANSYVLKPISMEDFIQSIQLIEDFWLGTVQLLKGDYSPA